MQELHVIPPAAVEPLIDRDGEASDRNRAAYKEPIIFAVRCLEHVVQITTSEAAGVRKHKKVCVNAHFQRQKVPRAPSAGRFVNLRHGGVEGVIHSLGILH